ncbi:hypothetical protein [Spirosoma sp. KUDC1026]|uniref:hypothetical protein n=1 Tax=Spirosoma sp. KUDC1026 TaxID=2745947 RepID=UPI00159B8945|nr:hypothetical protein [Spirosoma sp. KUDC1026]QKZ14033.1 hypothetical protein HU175_15915 [Spirosoma sp. KUDC1026]
MKSIITICLLIGLLSCKQEEAPEPAIKPTNFVGAYQFSGSITYSEATEGYLSSPRITRSGNVSGELLVTTFGSGTAIQIIETSGTTEVNKRYQASPATQQMVPLYTASSSASNADIKGSIYLINDKEISVSRTITTKYGSTYYTTEVSLRGVKNKS